jgi:hypothetical protein
MKTGILSVCASRHLAEVCGSWFTVRNAACTGRSRSDSKRYPFGHSHPSALSPLRNVQTRCRDEPRASAPKRKPPRQTGPESRGGHRALTTRVCLGARCGHRAKRWLDTYTPTSCRYDEPVDGPRRRRHSVAQTPKVWGTRKGPYSPPANARETLPSVAVVRNHRTTESSSSSPSSKICLMCSLMSCDCANLGLAYFRRHGHHSLYVRDLETGLMFIRTLACKMPNSPPGGSRPNEPLGHQGR